MRHQHARRELGQLARHAHEDHLVHAGRGGPAQCGAGEVAHLHEAHLGQVRPQRHGRLLGAARRCTARRSAGPARPAPSTACSTLARHDAVENGRTIPVVPRIEIPPRMPSRAFVVLRAIRSPPGTEMTTRAPRALRSATSPTAAVIMARGVAVMAGSADLDAQAGLGHHADPLAALQGHPGLGAPAHGGGQVGAVGHVRVVARVLDHHRRALLGGVGAGLDGEGHPPAAGQADLHAVLRGLVAQGGGRGLGRRGGAGAGGPPGPQRPGPDLGRPRQVRLPQLRLLGFLGLLKLECLGWLGDGVPGGSRAATAGCSAGSRAGSSRGPAHSRAGLAQRGAGRRVGPAETVEVAGVIQPRPGAARAQRGPDQEQRVLPELAGPDRLGQRADRALAP